MKNGVERWSIQQEPANGSVELKAVVLKACEYLPENRYVNISELHDD